jgi:hypothetical protein
MAHLRLEGVIVAAVRRMAGLRWRISSKRNSYGQEGAI